MAPAPDLAPPGSSSYSSNTLHVGDGTWDSTRDTFLLPNLVGLNFETMRYNGMGNRFAGLAGYHSLIKGHAIVAGITFLVIVPTAILIVRFMHGRPGWPVRLHIWLQIMTVILTTVVIILGFLAVGPDRALSNPHHGIGLAIYVLVLVQALGGWFVHSRERGKVRTRITIKAMLHHWGGRMIALLGIVQVPLGLTLYGSPKWLFIVYTLFMFVLLVLFFVLSYEYEGNLDYDSHSSYESRSEVIPDRADNRHSRLGSLAASGAAGAALATLLGHRNRSRSGSHPDVVGSHRPSQSYISQEKTDYEESRRGGGWGKRLLEIGAIGGGLALAKNFWDRRRGRDDVSYDYSTTEDSLSRVEDGRRPVTPNTRPPPRRSGSFSSRSSRTGAGPSRQSHGLRDGVATLGVLGLARSAFKGRKEKKEQKRLDDIRQRELEEERVARKNSERRRFTGDGTPSRAGRRNSYSETDSTVTGADGGSRHHHGTRPPIPSGLAAGAAAGAVTGAALGSGPNVSHNVSGPLDVPQPYGRGEDSGSEAYVSDGGRNHRRHHLGRDALAAGAVAGTAAGLASGSPGRHPRRSGENVNSPPVSIKMKMHNDGNHVTLRRLSEQEAAAEREARRRDRQGKHRRHRHGGSAGSLSGNEAGGSGNNDRWRRTEDRERREAEEMRRDNELAAQRRAQAGAATLPPPPPIGGGGGYSGRPPPSIGSPGTVTGTYDGTNTEASGDYETNRRRRRAERAARGSGRGSGTVDFN